MFGFFNPLQIVDVDKPPESSSGSSGRDILLITNLQEYRFLPLECAQIAVFKTNSQEVHAYTARMCVDAVF